MAKKAFVSLTGGLNNVDRPDTLEEDQLQECVNYEIIGVGRLEKRTDPSQYSSNLKSKLSSIFSEIIFVSEPYYPPNRIGDTGIDKHILFIYGKEKSSNYTMKLFVLSSASSKTYTMDNSMDDLYDNGLAYTAESAIDITVGDRGVYICDGVNPIHKVSVDGRGAIVASWVGLKSPTNKPRISVEPLNKQIDNSDSDIKYEEGDDSGLGGIGLIRCQYTIVSDTGQESNPSPASDFTNAQYFKIAADGVADERLIKSITVQDLNIPSVPNAVKDSISYFKIYYQIIRYSEGTLLDTMEFSSQVDIINKTTDAIDTKNTYIITNLKTSGETVSFENDTGFPCKVSSINAGVLMVGGLKKSANIPGDFQYMTPIVVTNDNTISVVDAIVKIQITPNDTKDRDDIVTFKGWHNYFSTQEIEDTSGQAIDGIEWKTESNSKHLRIYDNDMTSPIMVFVKDQWTGTGNVNQKLNIYVKIPLLQAGSRHILYFCWNDLSTASESGYTGIDDKYNDLLPSTTKAGETIYEWKNNIGAHYGRWILSTDENNAAQTRQQVFQERRVATAGTEILAIPHMASLGLSDDGLEGYDLLNIANTSCHGEATTEQDPHVVQNTCLPPVSSNLKKPDELEDQTGNYIDSPGSYWMVQNRFYDYEEKERNDVESYQGIAYRLTELLGWNKNRQIFLPLYRLRSDKLNADNTNVIGDGVADLTVDELAVSSEFTGAGDSSTDVTAARYVENTGYCTATSDSTTGYTNKDYDACTYITGWSWADWTSELWVNWNKNRGIGYIRGLAPITSLGSHGGNLANYLITNSEYEYTSLPNNMNRMNLNQAFNRMSPFLSSANLVAKFDGDSIDPDDHYSIGAFKPFCGGWSFKKSAESIGNIPDKGYFYTHLGFRAGDLQNAGSGREGAKTLKPSGSDSYYAEEQKYWYQNTVFYVACGAINDADAEPNHPLKYDPYPSNTTWETGKRLSHSQAVQYIDAHYNADNFRPTSESGADPGDINITETGDGLNANVPENGNVATHRSAGTRNDGDITEDTDVSSNTDPLNNLFFVHIHKGYAGGDEAKARYRIRLFVRTANGYDAHLWTNITEMNDKDGVDEFHNLFVYVSWDLVTERFALGYRYLDLDANRYTALRMKERDYSTPTTELKVRDALRNKPLYDMGLGNSTYMNRIVSASGLHKTFNLSGYHGFYGTTEMTSGVYKGDSEEDKHFISCLSENMPRFENAVGDNLYDNTVNNSITFNDTIKRTDKIYNNMIMWSEVNKDGLPDLNYKLLKEPVLDILSAPSFLKFEYSNTFLIFTRNTINRFVLKGTASGWSGSSESLIEEQVQYGLYAPKSLTLVGGELFWLSEEGVIRWNTEGMQNISGNVVGIPLDDGMIGFYCSEKNQYMLHNNATKTTFAYDLVYRRWTKFEGLDIISSSILAGGTNVENINLFLTSEGDIKQYPTSTKTSEDAHIKTMDLFMDSGQIKRVKVAYNGDSNANLTYNLAYNDKDSNNIEKSQTISAIEKNTWRGLGDLGRVYGRVANFEIENADEIFTIIYDAVARGND